MNLRYCVFLFAFAPLLGLATSFAQAQTRIGEAVIIKNEVLRVSGPSGSQINVGDGVLRDETVQTGADSPARFVMADTNLSLGANATMAASDCG